MRTTAIGVVAIPCAIATVSAWTRNWTLGTGPSSPDSREWPAPHGEPA
jgi:hypothetical protein